MTQPETARPVPKSEAATPAAVYGASTPGDASFSLLRLANVVLRRPGLLVGLPLVAGASAVVFLTMFGETKYRSDSVFKPQAPASPSNLSGLAMRFGISVSSNDELPDFYAKLVESRELMRAAAATRYRFAVGPELADTLSGTLADLYKETGSPAARIASAAATLDDDVHAVAEVETGTVTLYVSSPWPELSKEINRRLLALINEFNLERRNTQAAAERKFVQDRMAEAQSNLANAEEAMRIFLERNRNYQNSPQLLREYNRIQRVMELRQQIYMSLAQAYEEARLAEVRNTPVITVVDGPEGSVRRIGFSRALAGIMAFVIGLVLASVLALAGDYMARQPRENPEEFSEFRWRLRNGLNKLLPWRWFGRAPGRPLRQGDPPPSVVPDA